MLPGTFLRSANFRMLRARHFAIAAGLLTLLTLLFVPQLQAQSAGSTYPRPKFHDKIVSGLDSLFSMRVDASIRIFSQIVDADPKDPTGYFFRANVYLWKYLFNKNERDFSTYMSESEKTIDIGEDYLDLHEDDSFTRALIGGTYGYRALANITAENFLTASWDVRSCYRYLGELIQEHPDEYEAYLGMGIFQFALGSLPASARTVLNLVGLDGNREIGLRQLQTAATKATYVRNDARFTLALLYVYYKNDYDKGVGLLKDLLKEYPNNVPVLYSMGNVEGQLRKLEGAIWYFDQIIELDNKDFSYFTGYANMRRAEAQFRLNNFVETMRGMQRFLKIVPDKTMRCLAYFRLGIAYEMGGDRKNAEEAYRRASTLRPVTPEDQYANRKAALYLKKPLDAIEKELIRGANDVEAHKFDSGRQLLQPIAANRNATADQRAEAAYFLGEALRHSQEYNQALTAYKQVIELQPKGETWLIPWAYFRLSQVYWELGDKKSHRVYLDRSQVYDDYDYKDWLDFQIDRDLTRLQQ